MSIWFNYYYANEYRNKESTATTSIRASRRTTTKPNPHNELAMQLRVGDWTEWIGIVLVKQWDPRDADGDKWD